MLSNRKVGPTYVWQCTGRWKAGMMYLTGGVSVKIRLSFRDQYLICQDSNHSWQQFECRDFTLPLSLLDHWELHVQEDTCACRALSIDAVGKDVYSRHPVFWCNGFCRLIPNARSAQCNETVANIKPLLNRVFDNWYTFGRENQDDIAKYQTYSLRQSQSYAWNCWVVLLTTAAVWETVFIQFFDI